MYQPCTVAQRLRLVTFTFEQRQPQRILLKSLFPSPKCLFSTIKNGIGQVNCLSKNIQKVFFLYIRYRNTSLTHGGPGRHQFFFLKNWPFHVVRKYPGWNSPSFLSNHCGFLLQILDLPDFPFASCSGLSLALAPPFSRP